MKFRSKASSSAKRRANDALLAVAPLKRHFAAVLGRETLRADDAELRAFMNAAQAIANNNLALASLGVALVGMLMEHYQREIEKLLDAKTAEAGRTP